MLADELGDLRLRAAAQLGSTRRARCQHWLWEDEKRGWERETLNGAHLTPAVEKVAEQAPALPFLMGNGQSPHRPWGSPGWAGFLTSVRR